MINSFKLKDNEKLHIYCLSDLHLGSNTCNEEYFEYALNMIKNDKSPKVLYLAGDLLEIASKKIGDSAFTQKINVNKQIDTLVNYLKPFKNIINGSVFSNHTGARTQREFNLNCDKLISNILEIPYDHTLTDKVYINDNPYSIFVKHGNGSSNRNHLALGKIERDCASVEADLYFMGHLHRVGAISEVYIKDEEYKRKTFVLTGSFLSYKNSYAQYQGLSPIPEAFTRVDVDKNLNTSVNVYNIDEVAPELMKK